MSEAPASARLKLKAQIFLGDEIAMGPGKAELLEAIDQTGSISAAGRALGMSYRRTWLLVDIMNRCWREPLVTTTLGGSKGGGASITAFGRDILRQYRDLENRIHTEAETGTWRTLLSSLHSSRR